jgi:hypothetical protein
VKEVDAVVEEHGGCSFAVVSVAALDQAEEGIVAGAGNVVAVVAADNCVAATGENEHLR